MANTFLNTVFGGIARAFRSKSSLIFRTGLTEVYTDINTKKAIDNGFNSNTAVYSIVMKDAEKFGCIPRYLYDAAQKEEKGMSRKERKAYETYEGSDLVMLLNRPNEYQSQDAFFTALRVYYKICGECFIWLNRGDTMAVNDEGELIERSGDQIAKLPVLEMYVLPAHLMTAIPDPENLWGATGWIAEISGRRWRIEKENIIHWKMPRLDFDADTRPQIRGRSPLESGYKSLQQNNDATNASVRMYQNDGSKGAFTNETMDRLTPEQRSRIDDVIDAKINNNGMKGAVAALQGKWEYHDLGSSIDMKLLEGKELTWKELCFLFGMPYEFFDSHSPYAEKQLAQLGWVTNTIIPASKQLDGELNRVLLKAFDLVGKAFIGCDYYELPEMQEMRMKNAEALMKAWPITPNQVLEEMGYEKRPEAEFDEPWIPQGITPLSQYNDNQEMQSITQELADRGLAGSMNGKTNGVAK